MSSRPLASGRMRQLTQRADTPYTNATDPVSTCIRTPAQRMQRVLRDRQLGGGRMQMAHPWYYRINAPRSVAARLHGTVGAKPNHR